MSPVEPGLAVEQALGELSEEHERLDLALDRLAAVDVTDEARGVLHDVAVEVRDTVRGHLTREEPVLFPALRDHFTPEQWEKFSTEVIATTPTTAGHSMVGMLNEVGTPIEPGRSGE